MMPTVSVCLLVAFSLGLCAVNAVPRGLQDHKYEIIGAKSADIKDYPYTASVYMDILGVLIGSGAILNKNWIVCSAYGLKGFRSDYFTVRVGSSSAASGGQKVNISKAINHPQYNLDYNYDLVLLKTAIPLDLGQAVKSVKLADKLPAAGTQAQFTGFGKTEDETVPLLGLKAAKVKVMSQDECKKAHPILDDSSFCAHSDGVAPCESDIGSPLVYNNRLIGFYVGGDVCNYYGEPEIFTNIAPLAQWIKDTIKHNSNAEEMEGFADDRL